MSLANVENLKQGRSDTGVVKRLETIAGEIGALRDRLQRLQVRLDGGSLSDLVPIEPASGLKGNIDHIENNMRAIGRTMNALEELL